MNASLRDLVRRALLVYLLGAALGALAVSTVAGELSGALGTSSTHDSRGRCCPRRCVEILIESGAGEALSAGIRAGVRRA